MLRLGALAVGALASTGEVIVGTKANWDELLSSNPGGVLVEFYAPWCGHCKKLEPEYNKAAKKLAEEEINVPLVKVDATIEGDGAKIAGDFDVKGYPTLKWFVGGSPTEYDGPREADGIVEWIKTMTGPAVKEESPKDTDTLSVVWSGNSLTEFEALAMANRKKASWYWQKSGSDKIVLKHKGEAAIEWTGSDKEGMEKFFKDNAYPLFGSLDGETFGGYMERGNGLIWVLLDMTEDTVQSSVDAVRADMTEAAKELGTEYSVTWTNTVEFKKVLEGMFGVTEFPRIIVQNKGGEKKNFIYDGEITKASLLEYVGKVKSGEVQPHLKSEAIPESNDEPVRVIVGKTVETEVFTADKDVLLEVYAPWCGHCKKLEPEYNKVGKKVIKEGLTDILTIAKMDGTLNDSPVESLSWSGFPTLYYVKMGNSEPMKYDGPREAKGIWKWIKKNHSKADYIKEKLAAKTKEEEEKPKKEEL